MRFSFKLFVALACICGAACGCTNSSDTDNPNLGYWEGRIHTGRANIPFRFILSDTLLTLVNAKERIALSKTGASGDSTYWSFPQYSGGLEIHGHVNDSLWGAWNNEGLPDERFFFHAIASSEMIESTPTVPYNHFYNVFFNDGVKAFGAFDFSDSLATGTFLTETGDYRYLQGKQVGDQFWLSTFDGDHLYLAEGVLTNSGISNGKFYSRHKEPILWKGIKGNKNHLAHPDSLTQLHSPNAPFQFSVYNFSGEPVVFDADDFRGNVTIVSLFGSWCPNCHDELRFHRDLFNEINHSDLHMIPVAFERPDTITDAERAVNRVFAALDIPFEPLYGGKASKSVAAEVFPLLDQVHAFPTSLIIDKKGVVRKIHTGFSGPGTGQFYLDHKKETAALLRQLLQE